MPKSRWKRARNTARLEASDPVALLLALATGPTLMYFLSRKSKRRRENPLTRISTTSLLCLCQPTLLFEIRGGERSSFEGSMTSISVGSKMIFRPCWKNPILLRQRCRKARNKVQRKLCQFTSAGLDVN